MINIGESINEAIDWTQDKINSTRPVAERTLFSLLEAEAVQEIEEGFVLVEAEDEVERHHTKIKNHFTKNWKRFRFHSKRKNAKQNKQQIHEHHQNSKQPKINHLDNSDAAEQMDATDHGSSVKDEGMIGI